MKGQVGTLSFWSAGKIPIVQKRQVDSSQHNAIARRAQEGTCLRYAGPYGCQSSGQEVDRRGRAAPRAGPARRLELAYMTASEAQHVAHRFGIRAFRA
jgi:hypothetical protein